VSKAFDFLLSSAIDVQHAGRSIVLTRGISLQLDPVGDGAEQANTEKRSLEQLLWATTHGSHTEAETKDQHCDRMVNKHGSEVSMIVMSQELKYEIVSPHCDTTPQGVSWHSMLHHSISQQLRKFISLHT
jgi:hypothetical protein